MKETTHFGFKEVKTTEKQSLVKDVFDSVATKYDLMNDILSFGLHRIWKKQTIALSGVKKDDIVLDIAGGTGDLAIQFKDKVGSEGKVILADINASMLDEGRKKILDTVGETTISFVQTNAENLAFADSTFDIVSIAFGLRNVTDKDKAIAEMYRVLKPEGRLLILEFSKTQNDLLEKGYDFYSFNIMPKLGDIFANDSDSYKYLAESIRKHPDQETLKNMMLDVGFSFCTYNNFLQGVVALHKGIK